MCRTQKPALGGSHLSPGGKPGSTALAWAKSTGMFSRWPQMTMGDGWASSPVMRCRAASSRSPLPAAVTVKAGSVSMAVPIRSA